MAIESLGGKRCVITGAASGIGLATARAAAQRGAELYLTDVQEEALADAAQDIRATGGNVVLAQAFDIADHDAVMAFGAAVHEHCDSVDVVMNIAGISTWGTVETLEHRHWRRTVDIDLMGPIHVIEAFLPRMVEARRGGHLVNVSSAAGLFGLPWHAPYSAAKFGLRGVSEVLRFDLRRENIGVSLVCPGGVKTPLVGTVDIVGVDREDPKLRKMTGRFERHAVSPEHVAAKILRGIEKNRYLVFTSHDIHALYLLQRYAPPLYALGMQLANDQMRRTTRDARRRARETSG